MNPILSDFKLSLQKVVLQLKEDLKSIRTGRANTAILETISVDTYEGQTTLKLMELSTITVEGPSILVVTPYDPSTIQDIEKAILTSPLGFTPKVEANRIAIRIPPLSQEQREKYIKLISQKVEERKSIVRNERDEARKKIRTQFEAKEITEDDKYRMEKEIDSITQKLNTELLQIKEKKEEEIREV